MSNVVPFPLPHDTLPARRATRTPPPRVPNRQRRSREHLTADEVERLIQAAATAGRHRSRDSALILIAYRHGLRVSELVSLRWDQVDLERGTMHVNRCKRGDAGTHPLSAREVTILRDLQSAYPSSSQIFSSERGSPLTTSTVRKIVARSGELAGVGFPVHPHMLRHATGYYLANQGVDTRTIQAYLGHRNIMHTVRYTQLAADRFRSIWQDDPAAIGPRHAEP